MKNVHNYIIFQIFVVHFVYIVQIFYIMVLGTDVVGLRFIFYAPIYWLEKRLQNA